MSFEALADLHTLIVTNVLGLCDSYKTLMWKMKALCEYCSLTETRRVHDKRPVDR